MLTSRFLRPPCRRSRRGTAFVSPFAAVLAVSLIAPFSARAGTIAVRVSNITLAQNSIYVGQPLTVSYVLGGSGIAAGGIANVTIEILDGTKVIKAFPALVPPATGAQRGANTVSLDTTGVSPGSAYTVRVTANVTRTSLSGPNASDYFLISDSTDPAMQVYNPRGVDVNRNPASPYFGRVYVSNGEFGLLDGRASPKGVYILNPDLSEAFPGDEPRARDAGPNGGAWASSSNSPHRITIGPDDQIYICDWSDPHSGLYIADPNGENVMDLLYAPFPPGGVRGDPSIGEGLVRDAQGNELYSSISGVYVEGTGASRKVFVADYYMTPMGSIFRYDIPGGTTRWDKPPALAVMNNGYINTDSYHDVTRDAAGNFYVVNSTGTDENYKFDSSGAEVAHLFTGSANYGVAIDDARNKVAISTSDGRILLTDKSFQSATPIVTGLGNNVRDVAFDADGWVYAVDSADSRLYVYAPPGTYPVSGGSGSAAQTLSISGIPMPGDIAPVGPSGINVGPNGQRFGDGKVDMQDVVLSMRVFAGLNNLP